MTPDQLVRVVTDALGEHLASTGGRVTDKRFQQVLDLVAEPLAQTATGQRKLQTLRVDPSDTHNRAEVVDYLSMVVRRDASFQAKLTDAAARAGMGSESTLYTSTNASTGARVVNAHGTNVQVSQDDRSKRYHVGNIRFGTGGLVTAVVVGILLLGGGAAITAIAPGERERAAYQRRALTACQQANAVLSDEHTEVYDFGAGLGQGSTNPTDMLRIRKKKLLEVMQVELDRVSTVFAELDKVAVPSSLVAEKKAVDAAVADWKMAYKRGIEDVRVRVRDGMTATELLQLDMDTTGRTNENADLRLNSTMSNLAGETCTVV